MNVSALEFNFADFELLHCYNAFLKHSVVFNFAETVHLRISQNKSHAKFKAFTVLLNLHFLRYVERCWRVPFL